MGWLGAKLKTAYLAACVFKRKRNFNQCIQRLVDCMVVSGVSKNGQKSATTCCEEFASDGTGSSGAFLDGIDGVIADLVGEGTFVEPSLVEHFAESADIPSGM